MALTNLNNKGAQTAGQIVLAVTAVQSTTTAVTMFQKIASNVRSLGDFTEAAIQQFTLGFRYTLNSAFAKAGAIGAAIGGVVTWALFFAAWGKGGLSTDSVEFDNLVAGAVGRHADDRPDHLPFPLGGRHIILAVFAVFDLISLIICEAGVKAACSLGITEALTKLITEWIYTGGVMIDMKADPALTNIEDAQLRLTDPGPGAGGGQQRALRRDPAQRGQTCRTGSGIIYHYDNFFTAEDLGSTTVKYSLDTSQRKSKADLNPTTWWSIHPYSWVVAEVPSPVVGWLVPTIQSKDLYQGMRRDWLTSQVYPFDSPQINRAFPLPQHQHGPAPVRLLVPDLCP